MDAIWIQISDWAALYGLKIVGALAILIFGRMVVGIISGTIGRIMTKSKMDETLSKFLRSVIRISLMTVVVIMALGNIGIQTTSFIAIMAAAGLAIGLAFQNSLSNLASGILIIIFRPFKSGDYIEAGGSAGTVEEITIFTTVLKSPDNKKVIIPNSSITGGNIVNSSAKEMRRIDMVFGIGYDDDIRQAKSLLEEIIKADSRILDDPAPLIAVSELADSSVNFAVRPWVKTADYWNVYYDITEKVKLTFDEKGISIPYPQQDVHMHQVTAN
ncbi:MAG: mechanosensitive ion channel domain-containing protein [candidate division Zixibacteria bacterium]